MSYSVTGVETHYKLLIFGVQIQNVQKARENPD